MYWNLLHINSGGSGFRPRPPRTPPLRVDKTSAHSVNIWPIWYIQKLNNHFVNLSVWVSRDTVLGKQNAHPPGFLVITRDHGHQDRWKWFLPASRTFPNPPGPWGKAKNRFYRTRNFIRKNNEQIINRLINSFSGPIRGYLFVPSTVCVDVV